MLPGIWTWKEIQATKVPVGPRKGASSESDSLDTHAGKAMTLLNFGDSNIFIFFLVLIARH